MKTRLVLILVALFALSIAFSGIVFASIVVDFTQCANDNINNVPAGPCDFIGSNSQTQKAMWADGMAVPQRIFFDGIGTTTGDVHNAGFQWQWSKSTTNIVLPTNTLKIGHAYDFLVSWPQAKMLSKNIVGLTMTIGYSSTQPTADDPCENLKSGDYTLCRSMHNVSGGTGYSATVPLPSDTFLSVLCASYPPTYCPAAAKEVAFESFYGPRTITLYANQPIVINAMTITHTDSGGTPLPNWGLAENQFSGATYVNSSITYTSKATALIIETAPHIALGCPAVQNPILSWGCEFGGASIFSGSPYHFQNPRIDGVTSGSMDNQIQVTALPTAVALSNFAADWAPRGAKFAGLVLGVLGIVVAGFALRKALR